MRGNVSTATPPILLAWRRFVARYGWRAYALPVLTVVTLAVIVRGTPAAGTTAATSEPGNRSSSTSAGADFADDPAPAGKLRRNHDLAPVIVSKTTDSSACATNGYGQLALVSLNQQRAWMCSGKRQVYTTAVTTGEHRLGRSTPLGSWRVQDRQTDRYLVGPGYRDYVHYWVPFNGDFGFHDATWQTMAFGSPDYVTKGSHGCVHMPMASMKWFYNWAKVNTTVVTIEA